MTFRIIVRTDDANMAANVGGVVESTFKTIDVEIPALEKLLSEKLGMYVQRQIIGVEPLPPADREGK